MVSPTFFVSGGVAVLHACSVIYVSFKRVKRFREDCDKLAQFVRKIEAFIMQTEDEADMTGPGWQAAFSALHESLVEVADVFEMCGKIGMIRSMINADDLNLRLNAISQRLNLALQLIPIQKAKANEQRLANLEKLQAEIRAATFAAVSAAEQQSAALKRLIDQSRVDASKTQEMLEQVLRLLQTDSCDSSDGVGSSGAGCIMGVDRSLLEVEIADLQSELGRAKHEKRSNEEVYLSQIIMAITAMEPDLASHPLEEQAPPPYDLCCPITRQLMVDPVMLVDSSQTYDRAAIQEWLDRGNMKDPVTGVDITTPLLVPNVLVRKFVHEWSLKQQQPQAADTDAAADQGSSAACTAMRPMAARTASTPAAAAAVAAAAATAAAAAAINGDVHEDSLQLPGGQFNDAASLHHSTSSFSSSGRPFGSCIGFESTSTSTYPSIAEQHHELGFAALHQQQLRAHHAQQHMVQTMQPMQALQSPFVAAVPGSSNSVSVMATGGYRNHTTGGNSTGAAAGGPQGAFQLGELHSVLSRVGDSQYQMARRHSNAQAAEAVLQLQQQMQQERQQQEDRAYLQQHMERLMRSQQQQHPHQPQQQPAYGPLAINQQRCSISSSEAWPEAAVTGRHVALRAPSEHTSDHDSSLPLDAAGDSRGLSAVNHQAAYHAAMPQMQQAPPALRHYSCPDAAAGAGTYGGAAAAVAPAPALPRVSIETSVASASTQRASRDCSAMGRATSGPSAVPPRQPSQAVVNRSAISAPELGKRGQSSSRGVNRGSSDRSSDGSKAKKGLGAKMLSKLKSVSYFMVYDDEKC